MIARVNAPIQYYAAKGSHFSDKDAALIGPELERLGPKEAPEIVDAARTPDSPLHPYFEWDDSIAGQKHRECQARQMAQSIYTLKRVSEEEEVAVRAFYLVRDKHEGKSSACYTHLSLLCEDQAGIAAVLAEAKRYLQDASRRYSRYRSALEFDNRFGEVLDLIDKL